MAEGSTTTTSAAPGKTAFKLTFYYIVYNIIYEIQCAERYV